jgi:hypothetical protein
MSVRISRAAVLFAAILFALSITMVRLGARPVQHDAGNFLCASVGPANVGLCVGAPVALGV